MLATLNDVMKIAEEKQIAIGSFNTPNLEGLQRNWNYLLSSSLPSVMNHGFLWI